MSKTVKVYSDPKMSARIRAETDFGLTRSMAMNDYALLEQNMAMLFANLLGTSHRKALIAFEAVIDSRPRWVMLQKLLTLVHGDEYKTFFTGLIRDAGKINKFRNSLVHWILTINSRGQKPFDPARDIFLAEHPNFFGGEKIFLHEIISFSHKTAFYGALLFEFFMFLRDPDHPSDPDKTPWHEIFQSKPVYPPPLGHPLDRFHRKP